jgi:hypothetical protein
VTHLFVCDTTNLCSNVCGGSPMAFAVETLANTNAGTKTKDLFLTSPSFTLPPNNVLDGITVAIARENREINGNSQLGSFVFVSCSVNF